MKAIIISFTLKNQDFGRIKPVIEKIAKENPNTILIHGFLPRKEVIEKGFSTEVVDVLESNFPVQLNMYDKGVLRLEMGYIGKKLGAEVHIIGQNIDGVYEECQQYCWNKLPIIHHTI